ncbi:MAG: 1-acyl-sn-glycerol-3-phosphate acyltransferase [Clostridia bacterium]|nr:1-acyl-sn-glycerol-3-phosphate acyltransferase [Clostridia bacterium]
MSKEKASFAQKIKKVSLAIFKWFGVSLIKYAFCLVWWPRISYESKKAKNDLKKKQSIIISNHCYWFDPVMMYVIGHTSKMSVVAAKEVLTGIKGVLLRVLGCISVDRTTMDLVCLRECAKRVSEGEKVAIFPEGQINFEEELLPFKAGVSLIASRTGTRVIPVYLSGDYRPFGHLRVLVGESVDLSEEFSKVATAAEIASATDVLSKKTSELQQKLYERMTPKQLQGMKNFRAKFSKSREADLSEQKKEAHV